MLKNITILICSFSLFLTSCQFSEDIYINEDGSGKIAFSFDGSQFMQMAGDAMGEEAQESIDSTFSFKEILNKKKDSIATLSVEEQKKLKKFENYDIHMIMDSETKIMKLEVYTEFTDASNMQDMFKAMTTFSELEANKKETPIGNDKANPLSSLNNSDYTNVSYTYNGNKFTRNVQFIDKEGYKQLTDSLKQMSAMLGTSVYKLNYHFAKPIKSINNDNAMFSADRKTVTVEFPFMTYMLDPEALNLEVILED
ncbi:hypothetical protein [Neotamlana laminarinivorans]|uniref:Uncharacterized protein n=1 Tax=Neotamlana laminarinivorans TaxID=2883124 RepID=A0A9X1L258_9FLAO|nr:hypothetical protein [Tamlana laminarinivorans]MCB4799440.1 hypothetical protein [Tamlana laminarinivorans]